MRRCVLCFALFFAAVSRVIGFEPEFLSILAVENGTGYDITALFLFPAKGDYSGPDLLTGGRFIPQGGEESFFLYFEEVPGEEGTELQSARFDLLAVDTEGYQYRVTGLEAAVGNPVTARISVRNHLPLPPPLETVDIAVQNSTVPIFLIFLRPPGSTWWGASVLGPQEMLVSARTLILSVPSLGAAVPYEILAVDEDFDEYGIEVTVAPDMTSKGADGKRSDSPITGGPSQKDGGIEITIQLDDLKERQ